MSKQENGRSRRERLKTRLGFMRRRVLAGVAAMLMGVSLIFAGNVSAHNIDLVKAREVARAYARQVRDESGGKYAHYSTSCVAAFPGHNHIARCMIDYQNAADSERGTYTCRELIEIKMPPHSKSGQINFELYGYHASNNQCGSRRLNGTPMF